MAMLRVGRPFGEVPSNPRGDLPQTSCSALPRDLWSDVLRFLGPRESVKVACLDKFCRSLVYGSEILWQKHCLSRWPDCQGGLQHVADALSSGSGVAGNSNSRNSHNSSSNNDPESDAGVAGVDSCFPLATSWRQLYGDLAATATFRIAFEDAAAATEEARTRGEMQHAPTVERFVQAVHALGLAACAHGSVRRCRAYGRHVHEELGWWLAERPQALVRFVRSLHVGLLDAQLCGSSTLTRMWSSTYCWQRSAVQFLLEAPFWDRYGQLHQHQQRQQQPPLAGVVAAGDAGQWAALQRLLRECEALDATIRRLHKEVPAAMSLGLAAVGCSTTGSEAVAAAAEPSISGGKLPSFVAGGGGQGLCQRGLCFDDVEEEWRTGGHAESLSGRGGLLACRRLVEPRSHWWAWMP